MPTELYTDRALFWGGSLLYAMAFLFALVLIGSKREHIRTIFMTLLVGGFIFQSLGLYFRGIQEHAFPTSNPFEVLQVMAWCAICLNLVLRQVFKLNLLNFFSSGLAAVVGVISLAVPGWDYIPPLSPLEGSPWVGFHAALAVFSYGVFGVLAITSLMYLMQNHGLTRRKSGGIFSLLPAIRQLEDINSKLIVLGVSVLTVSIAVGFLNWISQPGTVGVIKLLIASAVWAAYFVLLYLRNTNKMIASPFARACVVLFIAALFSLWPLTIRNTPQTPADATGMLNDANQR